jgi:hypothetical protein
MKYFGIGSIILPVIGAKAEPQLAAQLIELPVLRPVELAATVPEPFDLAEVGSASLILSAKNGQLLRLDIPNIQEAWHHFTPIVRWPRMVPPCHLAVGDKVALEIGIGRAVHSSPVGHERIASLFGFGEVLP